MSHTAEIIAVGTELLLGNIVNTNAQEISQALSGVGVNVFWHTVVGDNPERLRQALGVVAHHRVPEDVDADGGQGLGDVPGIGVDDVAEEQLRAHGDDLSGM